MKDGLLTDTIAAGAAPNRDAAPRQRTCPDATAGGGRTICDHGREPAPDRRPWPARVAAVMAQIDALIDEQLASPHPTMGAVTGRWLSRLEQAHAELARLTASESALAAERAAALSLLAREAPALYEALATAALAMTATTAPSSTLLRPPGWGLAMRSRSQPRSSRPAAASSLRRRCQ